MSRHSRVRTWAWSDLRQADHRGLMLWEFFCLANSPGVMAANPRAGDVADDVNEIRVPDLEASTRSLHEEWDNIGNSQKTSVAKTTSTPASQTPPETKKPL